MWLFALLKHNVQRECLKGRLSTIHHAFIDFLSDDSGKIIDTRYFFYLRKDVTD